MNESFWTSQVLDYLEYRRCLGFSLKNEEKRLLQFARFAEAKRQEWLTVEFILLWVHQSSSKCPITWARRLDSIRGFARYCQRADGRTEIPSGLFGSSHRRLTPHVFDQEETMALLRTTKKHRSSSPLRRATYYAIFGLLASCGLRISEAVGLTRADVDLGLGLLNIRESKLHKQRLVPLHPTVSQELQSYAQKRDALAGTPKSDSFFLVDSGSPANQRRVRYMLQSVCRELGWNPRGDYPRHRLHDLRHSFIVRNLVRAYERGIDANGLLATLSAYVGHAHIADTYWYLTGVTELMALASERFHRHVLEVKDEADA